MSTSTPRLGLVKPAGGEQYARSVLNNNSDLVDAFASGTVDIIGSGFKTYGKTISNSAAVSALSVIHNIATFTFKAGRRYKIIWDGQYFTSVASTFWVFRIQSCSTADAASLTTGLTQLQSRTYTSPGSASSTNSFRVEHVMEPGSDTTVQIKFTVQNAVGGGTITVQAGASEPVNFYIEDMGDQF